MSFPIHWYRITPIGSNLAWLYFSGRSDLRIKLELIGTLVGTVWNFLYLLHNSINCARCKPFIPCVTTLNTQDKINHCDCTLLYSIWLKFNMIRGKDTYILAVYFPHCCAYFICRFWFDLLWQCCGSGSRIRDPMPFWILHPGSGMCK